MAGRSGAYGATPHRDAEHGNAYTYDRADARYDTGYSGFCRIYLAEMRYLVPRLAGGSPHLHRRAWKVVGLGE